MIHLLWSRSIKTATLLCTSVGLFLSHSIHQVAAQKVEAVDYFIAEVTQGTARFEVPPVKGRSIKDTVVAQGYLKVYPGTAIHCLTEGTRVIVWGGASPLVLEKTKTGKLLSDGIVPAIGDGKPANLVAKAFRIATKPLGRKRAGSLLLWPQAERTVAIQTFAVRWDPDQVKGKFVTLLLKVGGAVVWSAKGLDKTEGIYDSASLRTTLRQYQAAHMFTLVFSSSGATTDAIKFQVFTRSQETTLKARLIQGDTWNGEMSHLFCAEVYFESGLYPEAASEYAAARESEPNSILVTLCEERVRMLYTDSHLIPSHPAFRCVGIECELPSGDSLQ